MNRNPDAILFDLDGVLIDSEGLYSRFWEETEKIHPTGIPNFAAAIKGTTLPQILEHFRPEFRQDIINRIFEFDANLEYPLFDGARELLEYLVSASIPAALVTSSNPEKMHQLYRQYPDFANFFAVVIDGSMVDHGKPSPEGYLKAAQRIGVDPTRCVVIEDSLQGIHAGLAAGAEVWGLWTTIAREIVEAEAVVAFPDINAVRKSILHQPE